MGLLVYKKPIFLLWFLILGFFIISCEKSSNKNNSKSEDITVGEILVDGQRQYHLRGCVKCHGTSGAGDGYRTSYLSSEQKPRNFKDLTAYKQGSDLTNIMYTIRNGIKNSDNNTSAMPAYPMLTMIEVSHIAQYVLHLQTNN